MFKPVVLLILDGWGIAPKGPGNAIALGPTPHFSRLQATFPHTQLLASGEAVGLPKGEVGNTETGHLNLGAGHIVYQDLPRINQAIADGSFFKNEAFLQAVNHIHNYRSHLHLIGLVGSGGVHSSNDHLFALLRFAKNQNLSQVYLHLFTDGRDSPPTSALSFIDKITQEIDSIKIGQIATLIGRYYAMDRDLRWDRTQIAYQALTEGKGTDANSARDAIRQAYATSVTDEFIPPTIILDSSGKPLPRITHNDAVIFFNFRIDRPRQLTKAFVLPNFETYQSPVSFDPYDIKYYKHHLPEKKTPTQPFTRTSVLHNLFFITMTEYEKGLPVKVAYPLKIIANPLGRVIADSDLRQLRLAETEKERFVTYYFNGLREDPFPGEDRIIIPSAKVATYDLKPEMSVSQITHTLIERSASQPYDLIVANLANADMVGHTGNIAATSRACSVIDQEINKIVLTVLGQDGAVIITADHGKAEQMINPQTGEVNTEHSGSPVPFILVSNHQQPATLQQGILADVAPTILKLLGIPKPSEMTGQELI